MHLPEVSQQVNKRDFLAVKINQRSLRELSGSRADRSIRRRYSFAPIDVDHGGEKTPGSLQKLFRPQKHPAAKITLDIVLGTPSPANAFGLKT